MDRLGTKSVARGVPAQTITVECMGTKHHKDAVVWCRLLPTHRKIPYPVAPQQDAAFETNQALYD